MVIFGAGASYDSDPARAASREFLSNRHPDRPPLANELFDNRPEFAKDLAPFPECIGIVPLLRGTSAIEEQLERLQSEATGEQPYPTRLRQLAAVRWYFQMMLSGCDQRWYDGARGFTNYSTLLDEILRWGHKDVLLVTFNYDRLLEFAARDITRQSFERMPDYIGGPFSIIKLHGSVNWGRAVLNPPITFDHAWEHVHAFIERVASLAISDQYVVSSSARSSAIRTSARCFPRSRFPCSEAAV